MGGPVEASTVCCAELIALWNIHQEAGTYGDEDGGFHHRPACFRCLLRDDLGMRASFFKGFTGTGGAASNAERATSTGECAGGHDQSAGCFAGDSGGG